MSIDLTPSVKNVRAIVTTKWGNSSYRPLIIRSLESYYVDTAIDNDSDLWSIEIGDPDGQYLDLLARDNEVRVQLFGAGAKASRTTDYILTGIADEISYDDQGSFTITGRDLSSIATDSTVPPGQFRFVRPWSTVEQQAKQLGFTRTSLARKGIIKKVFFTDGSESYWEFWYRLYRREKMWLWCSPEGILVANSLDYTPNQIDYFFGKPKDSDSALQKTKYIPVERVEIRKSTQQRVGEVWVFGHKGDNGFRVIAKDPTLKGWMKSPRKIMLDTESHTAKGAEKLAWEEIFEGKVGSIEVRVTVAEPGFAIRQNKIASVHIPEIGFAGTYYVVGSRIQAGINGFVQEVRMREIQYSISRRVPKDPKIVTTEPQRHAVIASVGQGIAAAVDNIPESWATWFVNAAKEHHGPWDFNLFLATLLGIADQETGGTFRNIRARGGPGGDNIEWYPFKTPEIEASTIMSPPTETRKEWEKKFANEPGVYTNKTFAVGPMQLYSLGYKHWADDNFKPGNRNEFTGGRWHPKHNIWAGARALREKLKLAVGDSGRDIDMWAGVSYYGQHEPDEPVIEVPTRYAVSVKNKVYNDPGYLVTVRGAIDASRQAADSARDGATDVPAVNDTVPKEIPNQQAVEAFWSNYVRLPQPTIFETQQAVVNAALFAKYNRSHMHYTSSKTNPGMLGQRMRDFAPPPNVPDYTDCSGFVTWCYKSARTSDPNGNNYNGQGYTGTLWDNGKAISYAQIRPGDLVFYGNPASTHSHVALYVGFNTVISHGSEGGPWMVPVRYRSDIHGFRTYLPGTSAVAGGPTEPPRAIMIQAGHDEGAHSDQPYGHLGQTGAIDEVDFNIAVRDALYTKLNSDSRFAPEKGTAWTASSGETLHPSDDINWKGDIFIALHAYRDAGLSGYFFGWPTARGSTVETRSKRLRDSIVNRWTFSGAPARNAGKDNTLETYYGYYAWGHPTRGFPDNVDHTAGTPARLLIECGHLGTDGILTKENEIAIALYQGICDYFGYTPLP